MKHGINTYWNGCHCDVCRAGGAEYSRGRYRANRDKMLARKKCYRAAHPEKIAAYNRLYREAHPELAAGHKRYYKANRTKALVRSKLRYEKVRAKLINHLGGCCAGCGVREDLQFDHVDPETKSERMRGLDKTNSIECLPEKERWEEVEKCQLLCVEHHRIKTSSERRTV